MKFRRGTRLAGLAAALTAWWLAAPPAGAHPMGNFAICHYARLRAEEGGLRVRFVLDFAEIPAVAEKRRLDRDGDGSVSPEEEAAYLEAKAAEVLPALTLAANGVRLPLRREAASARLVPGAGGLDTLKVIFDLSAPWPAGDPPRAVVYRDASYEARTGWKEVVAVAGPGVVLDAATVPAADRSRELSDYPPDVIPPQVTEARFTARPDPSAAGSADPAPAAGGSGRTPRDAFTEAVAARDLGTAVVVTGLLIAFAFGALHALSPGHGKAMVAAYLVGSRSTMSHAVLLGGVVTVTHTLGVFALGLATLLASRYVLPEVLYPVLSALSGATVCGLGLWLLYRRVRRLLRGSRPGRPAAAGHGHELPEGPLTVRSLVALGVSGGIIPCPSALVVLLAAVALHRVGYGLLLITAFSAGLAAVLVAIGMLVVRARRWLEGVRVSGALLRRVPVASAAVITLIGLALLLRAFGQVGGW